MFRNDITGSHYFMSVMLYSLTTLWVKKTAPFYFRNDFVIKILSSSLKTIIN